MSAQYAVCPQCGEDDGGIGNRIEHKADCPSRASAGASSEGPPSEPRYYELPENAALRESMQSAIERLTSRLSLLEAENARLTKENAAMREYPWVQTCPVCAGQGTVSRPPWVAGDAREWMSAGSETYPCRACDGTGIIRAAARVSSEKPTP